MSSFGQDDPKSDGAPSQSSDARAPPKFISRLTFKAISEIFLVMIKRELSRKGVNSGNIAKVKENLKLQTQLLAEHAENSINLILNHSHGVIRHDMTILVHGFSKSVVKVLESAAERGIKISVFTTECQPRNQGKEVQKFCEGLQIPCKTILDSAVGMCISSVDCVFVGAEAVLENGGIANRIGTFTVALCAKAYNKPFY